MEWRDIQEDWTAGSQKTPRPGSGSPNPVYGIRPGGSQRGVSISGQERKEKEEGGRSPRKQEASTMEDQQRSVDRKATSEGIPEFSQGISRASPKSRDLANTQDVCV